MAQLKGGTYVGGDLIVASTLYANTMVSSVATGTAPLSITSTTMVSNLNADLLDGQHGAYYQPASTAITTGNIGSQSVSYATTAGSLTSMNISQFTNNSGYITGYTEADTLASVTGRGYVTRNSSGAFASGGPEVPGLEVYGAGGAEPAFITFHRPGVYAMKLGLDGSDLKVGGWSMGAVAYTIMHAGNIGSQSVNYATSAGNADTVDSLHVASGVNNVANQIVRTDGSGYLQTGYINSGAGNEGNNSNPARVWGTNGSDAYLRTYLTSALSVSYAATAGSAPASDVYTWAKQATKPSYTAGEVGAEPALGNPGTSGWILSSTTGGTRSWIAPPAAGSTWTTSVISTNTNAVKDYIYVLTASLVLTLPASPSSGDAIKVSNMSGTTTGSIARNGKNIMGLAEDLVLDKLNAGFEMIYADTTRGWVII